LTEEQLSARMGELVPDPVARAKRHAVDGVGAEKKGSSKVRRGIQKVTRGENAYANSYEKTRQEEESTDVQHSQQLGISSRGKRASARKRRKASRSISLSKPIRRRGSKK